MDRKQWRTPLHQRMFSMSSNWPNLNHQSGKKGVNTGRWDPGATGVEEFYWLMARQQSHQNGFKLCETGPNKTSFKNPVKQMIEKSFIDICHTWFLLNVSARSVKNFMKIFMGHENFHHFLHHGKPSSFEPINIFMKIFLTGENFNEKFCRKEHKTCLMDMIINDKLIVFEILSWKPSAICLWTSSCNFVNSSSRVLVCPCTRFNRTSVPPGPGLSLWNLGWNRHTPLASMRCWPFSGGNGQLWLTPSGH